MENKTFAGLMVALGLVFEKGDISKEKIALYQENLADIRIDVLAVAIKKIIKTRKYPSFPTIGEIREAALGPVEDDISERGLLAWDRANQALVSGIVQTDTQEEKDRIERAVKLAFGSWEKFGQTDPDAESFDRKHFIECYRLVASKEERQENLLEQIKETRAKIESMRPTIPLLKADGGNE